MQTDCVICGAVLAAGEVSGLSLLGQHICVWCFGAEVPLDDDPLDDDPSLENPCDDPSCAACAPLPTDPIGVIALVSHSIAREAAAEVKDMVASLVEEAGLQVDPDTMAETQNAAAYFTAIKIIAVEAEVRHRKCPGRGVDELHAALAVLSHSLSVTLGRRVAIQIVERDGKGGV